MPERDAIETGCLEHGGRLWKTYVPRDRSVSRAVRRDRRRGLSFHLLDRGVSKMVKFIGDFLFGLAFGCGFACAQALLHLIVVFLSGAK